MSPKIKLLINDDDFHMIDEGARYFLEWLDNSRDDGNKWNWRRRSKKNVSSESLTTFEEKTFELESAVSPKQERVVVE